MIDMSDPFQVALGLWALIGLVVAVAFLLFGIDDVDEAAHGAYAVRPLLVPGLALLWPIVVWRWAKLTHRRG